MILIKRDTTVATYLISRCDFLFFIHVIITEKIVTND